MPNPAESAVVKDSAASSSHSKDRPLVVTVHTSPGEIASLDRATTSRVSLSAGSEDSTLVKGKIVPETSYEYDVTREPDKNTSGTTEDLRDLGLVKAREASEAFVEAEILPPVTSREELGMSDLPVPGSAEFRALSQEAQSTVLSLRQALGLRITAEAPPGTTGVEFRPDITEQEWRTLEKRDQDDVNDMRAALGEPPYVLPDGGGGGPPRPPDEPGDWNHEEGPEDPGYRLPTNFRRIDTVPPRDKEREPLPSINRIVERICGWYRRRAYKDYDQAYTHEEAGALTRDMALYLEYIDDPQLSDKLNPLMDAEDVILREMGNPEVANRLIEGARLAEGVEVPEVVRSYNRLLERGDNLAVDILMDENTLTQLERIGVGPEAQVRVREMFQTGQIERTPDEDPIAEVQKFNADVQGHINAVQQIIEMVRNLRSGPMDNLTPERRRSLGREPLPEAIREAAEQQMVEEATQQLKNEFWENERSRRLPEPDEINERVEKMRREYIVSILQGGAISSETVLDELSRALGRGYRHSPTIADLATRLRRHELVDLRRRLQENRSEQTKILDAAMGLAEEVEDEEEIERIELPAWWGITDADMTALRDGLRARGEDREPNEMEIKARLDQKTKERRSFSQAIERWNSTSLTAEEMTALRNELDRDPDDDELEARLERKRQEGRVEVIAYLKLADRMLLLTDAEDQLDDKYNEYKHRLKGTDEQVRRSASKLRNELYNEVLNDLDNVADALEGRCLNDVDMAVAYARAERLGIDFDPTKFEGVISFYTKQGYLSLENFLNIRRKYGFHGEPSRQDQVDINDIFRFNPVEGVWNWRDVDQKVLEIEDAERKRRGFWAPTGSGFYTFSFRNIDEVEAAANSHLEELLGKQKIDPQAVLRDIEYFGMGLLQWAKMMGIEGAVDIRRRYDVQALAFLAEKFNRAYDARNLAAVYLKMNDIFEGMDHWEQTTKILNGLVFRADMFQREPEYEWMYQSGGPFGQLAHRPHAQLYVGAFPNSLMRKRLARSLVGELVSDSYLRVEDGKLIGFAVGQDPSDRQREARVAHQQNLETLGLDQPREVIDRAFVPKTEELFNDRERGVLTVRIPNLQRLLGELGQPLTKEHLSSVFTAAEIEALKRRDIQARVEAAEELSLQTRPKLSAAEIARKAKAASIIRCPGNPELERMLRRVILGDKSEKEEERAYTAKEKKYYQDVLKECEQAVTIMMQLKSMTGDKTQRMGPAALGDPRTENGSSTVLIRKDTGRNLDLIREELITKLGRRPTVEDLMVEINGAKLPEKQKEELQKSVGEQLRGIRARLGIELGRQPTDDEVIRAACKSSNESIKATFGSIVEVELRSLETKESDRIPYWMLEQFGHYAVQRAKMNVSEYNDRLNSQIRGLFYAQESLLKSLIQSGVSEKDANEDSRVKDLAKQIRDLADKTISRSDNRYKFLITLARDNALQQVHARGWQAKLFDYDIEKLHDANFKNKVFGEKDDHGKWIHRPLTAKQLEGFLQTDKKVLGWASDLIKTDESGRDVYLTIPGRDGQTVNLLYTSQDPLGRYLESTYIANQIEIQEQVSTGVYVAKTSELLRQKLLEGNLGPSSPDIDYLTLSAEEIMVLSREIPHDTFTDLFTDEEWEVLELRDIRARIKGLPAILPGNEGKQVTSEELGRIRKDHNITEAARRIRDGESRQDEEDILATLRLIVDPTLDRILPRDAEAAQKQLEENILFQCEESYLDRLEVRIAASIRFAELTEYGIPNADGATKRLFNPDALGNSNPDRWAPRARWILSRLANVANGLAAVEGLLGDFDVTKLIKRKSKQDRRSRQEITDNPRLGAVVKLFEIGKRLNDKMFGTERGEGGGDPHDPGGTEKWTRSAEKLLIRIHESTRRQTNSQGFQDIVPWTDKTGRVPVRNRDGSDGYKDNDPKLISLSGSEVKFWTFANKDTQDRYIKLFQEILDTPRAYCEILKLVSDNTAASGAWNNRYRDVTRRNILGNLIRDWDPERLDEKTGTRIAKDVGRARHIAQRVGNYFLDLTASGKLVDIGVGRPYPGSRLEYPDVQGLLGMLDHVRLHVSDISREDRALFPEYFNEDGTPKNDTLEGPTLRQFIIGKWSRR